ncbi:GNAT family N-acetyltransferase [Actinomyces viscosus]|uniref:Acetyltransferase (GNAT) family n=1 Tax=Actinomyces viscosus TaxID=1656 RepID=A0A448PJT5_ACTVI|nr:GNAT family N-acetyltransferase [Actinomyces viscosus]TFH54118.1 GNAT family N-acetyltransferase [Actinomyces viscosus]VEI15321.1 Acetyltransferase (GNAT) family [Actinomyces viscosus]
MDSSTPASPSSSASPDGSFPGADPLNGLGPDLDARAPHQHAHGGAQGPAGFVRPARVEDLEAIGEVQAATMLASLQAGHAAEHDSPLPEGVRAMIAAPVIAAGWEAAVVEPPSPRHHVLVATTAGGGAEDRAVVGLLGLAPTQSMDAKGQVDEAGVRAVEVTALGVEPASQRRGHGSRLLAAAVDLARQDGARALVAWAVRGDESVGRLLASVGMAPTGAHRVLGVGEGITEDCWAASL